MTRISCHSAFKHYEMFHSNHCGGNNYGSVFNTTYNIDCNGRGGFGFGLGNAFGGMFSGMFGGGMTPGLFGLGGISNFWQSPWLTPGGGRYTPAERVREEGEPEKKSPKVETAECNDPDRRKLANHVESVKNLLGDAENLTPDKLKDLYNKIKADKELSQDEPNHKTTDNSEYNSLLDALKKKAEALGWGDIESSDFGKNANPETKQVGPEQKDPLKVDTGNKDLTLKEPGADEAISAAKSFDDLPDYNSLSDADKAKYLQECIDLGKSDATSPDALRAALAKLPPEVRTKVKQSFYKEGYSNVQLNELDANKLKKLIEVIDDSPITDFKNIKVGTPTKSGENLWTIPMTSQYGTTKINYIQVSVDSVDGEIIFHGRQNTQHYVLQQDAGSKLHLMQYKYHEGYAEPDVKG